jgi:hypothetical protein
MRNQVNMSTWVVDKTIKEVDLEEGEAEDVEHNFLLEQTHIR